MSFSQLPLEKFTPVMQQYLRARRTLKENTVLFFRMGDFYEAFFEDAKTIAKELEITLTGRPESNYPGGRIPMAGVPAKAVKNYIARLLEKNFKVCVAEQMADPKTCKGLVPREITHTYTPGTINDLDLLSSYKNNFLLSLVKATKEERYGLAYADISTGEFFLTELDSKYLEQELSRINATEILIPSIRGSIEKNDIEARESPCFKFETELKNLNSTLFPKNNFNEKFMSSYPIEGFHLGKKAAGGLIEYFKETQFDFQALKSFERIRTYLVDEFMMIDSSTRKNLELVKNLNNGSKSGTLFETLDFCSSNMGKRKLQSWIEQPLYDVAKIELRLDAISELLDASVDLENFRNIISEIYDIERLSKRLSSESINAREIITLKNSLIKTLEISSLIANHKFKSPYLNSLKSVPAELLESISKIESAILEDPSISLTEGGLIKEGFHHELDDYISLVKDSNSWLKNFEEDEKNSTGIKNLKVSFNRVHGYFIEVSKSNEKHVPEHYICKQTMVNCFRYITSELKEFEEKINNAEFKRNSLEYKIFIDLRRELSSYSSVLNVLSERVSTLDVLISFSKAAIENSYSRPVVDNSKVLKIHEGRHPVVESKMSLGNFVPNDISLEGADRKSIMILTGPNMAGKSTYMRQNALIILMAQIGSFVPAKSAHIGLVDRIFTRIGASDDLASGKSTFMVEMVETASILNGISDKSFVLLDEIGRGTSTFDGISIAWAILEHIAREAPSRTIFSTHYHELANLELAFPNIVNFHMAVIEANSNRNIEFLHKVKLGSANKSYGIEVAKLSGIPSTIISRARSINNQLQANRVGDLNKINKKLILSEQNQELDKLPLFEGYFSPN